MDSFVVQKRTIAKNTGIDITHIARELKKVKELISQDREFEG
jgi:hypothetical protein